LRIAIVTKILVIDAIGRTSSARRANSSAPVVVSITAALGEASAAGTPGGRVAVDRVATPAVATVAGCDGADAIAAGVLSHAPTPAMTPSAARRPARRQDPAQPRVAITNDDTLRAVRARRELPCPTRSKTSPTTTPTSTGG
jgi:hypothetical protein